MALTGVWVQPRGGMSIVLGVMADQYNAAMALCGIDTLRIMAQLPYLWSQVLTHKQSIL